MEMFKTLEAFLIPYFSLYTSDFKSLTRLYQFFFVLNIILSLFTVITVVQTISIFLGYWNNYFSLSFCQGVKHWYMVRPFSRPPPNPHPSSSMGMLTFTQPLVTLQLSLEFISLMLRVSVPSQFGTLLLPILLVFYTKLVWSFTLKNMLLPFGLGHCTCSLKFEILLVLTLTLTPLSYKWYTSALTAGQHCCSEYYTNYLSINILLSVINPFLCLNLVFLTTLSTSEDYGPWLTVFCTLAYSHSTIIYHCWQAALK